MKRLAIIGASGHGRVIADIAKKMATARLCFLMMMKPSTNVVVIGS